MNPSIQMTFAVLLIVGYPSVAAEAFRSPNTVPVVIETTDLQSRVRRSPSFSSDRRSLEPSAEERHRNAGKYLARLEDEARMVELLTRGEETEALARRREIAEHVLGKMRKHSLGFVEALCGNSTHTKALASAAAAPGITPGVAAETIRRSLRELRATWSSWLDHKNTIEVGRYERLQRQAARLVVAVDALRSIP